MQFIPILFQKKRKKVLRMQPGKMTTFSAYQKYHYVSLCIGVTYLNLADHIFKTEENIVTIPLTMRYFELFTNPRSMIHRVTML